MTAGNSEGSAADAAAAMVRLDEVVDWLRKAGRSPLVVAMVLRELKHKLLPGGFLPRAHVAALVTPHMTAVAAEPAAAGVTIAQFI